MRTYDTDRMVTVAEMKKILRARKYTNRRFRLVDTSGHNSYGYSFNLVEQEKTLHKFQAFEDGSILTDYLWDTIRIIASTVDTSYPNARNMIGGIGAYGPSFDRADVADCLPVEVVSR